MLPPVYIKGFLYLCPRKLVAKMIRKLVGNPRIQHVPKIYSGSMPDPEVHPGLLPSFPIRKSRKPLMHM
jgi:hypothetical protein